MSALWLVRHLPTAADPARLVGSTDLPLADPTEAERLATRLAPLVVGQARIVSSDLERAVATATPLARKLGAELAVTPALRELDFGAWEGLTWDEVAARDPERHAAWFADWQTTRAPGGESLSDLQDRVARWWTQMEARTDTDTPLLIVAHATSLRALAHLVTGESMETLMARPFPRGSWWALHEVASQRP